jgi:hypothetical protein
LAIVAIAGILIRLVLLPTEGLKGDLDQFVLWVHGIAVNGLGHAYDQNLSFPAVMALIWGALAAVEPAFRTVTDSADPWIRTLMKIPASLADLGLAALLVYAFRARPWWAVVAAAAVLLHPAVIDTSAWWGQYESIYVLFALAAVVFVLNGHDLLGAAALAICVMTKPQALPFVLPFVAWYWAHGGWREIVRVAAVGLVVAAVLWLPFVPSGGPVAYLRNLADYQNNVFPVLSLNAWNIWWLVQVAAVGTFAGDNVAVLGPITLRHLGFALTVVLSIVVAVLIVRDPRPRTFILGLAASTLIWYGFLTQMHERYAFGALVFLALLLPERRLRWLWVVFGVVFTLNLVTAQPPAPIFRELLPNPGWPALVGSIVMIAITAITLLRMTDRSEEVVAARDHRVGDGPEALGVSSPP